jgi:hypothetical protein
MASIAATSLSAKERRVLERLIRLLEASLARICELFGFTARVREASRPGRIRTWTCSSCRPGAGGMTISG